MTLLHDDDDDNKSNSSHTSSTTPSLSSSKTTLFFELFPDQTLQIQLLIGISDPYSKSLPSTLAPLSSNFALLNAHRIVSVGHVAVAANNSLLQSKNINRSITLSNNGNIVNNNDTQRGLALNTIICAGGSSHAGNVLRDFGFQRSSKSENDRNERLSSYSVLVLGWNCSALEMTAFVDSILIGEDKGRAAPLSQLSRKRTDNEVKDIIKTFKLTKEDVEMETSSLEHAVITRVAAKYLT